MAKTSVTDLKDGVNKAETEATRHATELADRAYASEHKQLAAEATNTARSLAAANTMFEAKKIDLHDQAILVGSLDQNNNRAQDKLRASSQKHEAQLARLSPRPPPPTMPPPPPRSSSAAAARAVRRTQPDTWATVASGNYHAPQPTDYDDSYLDVRVSAFRHCNEKFPQAIRDQTFDLSSAVYLALRPTRHEKASLRLARDLASSQRSPFRPETVDEILTLCNNVRQAYNTPAARPWFQNKLSNLRPALRWQPRSHTDSASDSSVGTNRQRHREDPASGRGKAKRSMTALTTDSDSSSDAQKGTLDDYRHLRQASPRFYHAPELDDGTEPPFPPRTACNRMERRAPLSRPRTTPALAPRAERETNPVNDNISPLHTQLLIETITNATLAAVNRHLVSAGLLPHPTANPHPTELSLTRTVPPPSHLVQQTAPTPTTNNVQYLNHDTRCPQVSGLPLPANTASPAAFDHAFTAKMQAEYRTLDTRRVPRIQPLQFSPITDRTAATQLLVHSIRDALSGIFDVAEPSGYVTMRSPFWVSGWHAPLLKLTKGAIIANRDDTHILHRLIDDRFAQLQERLASGVNGPAAFGTLLTDVADYFDRAPRGAGLATLQQFGVPSGTPFSSFLRSFRVIVASTVEKGGPLAPSPEMAMELIRIRTAQQYPMLMPTLFPGVLATRERPYDSLATLWTVFANLKHNTSPAIDGDAFASAHQGLRSLGHNMVTPSGSPTGTPHRHARRTGHGVFNVSPTHSRRDPFTVDYGLWPFDDRDYGIVCTVTNNVVNTDLSLWTPLLSEDARRQACIQYKGRCCNCGSTEHSLRWCPAPFKNMFSLLNPEFGTHDPDGSVFETWKIRMRRWRQNSPRGRQHNNRRNDTGNGHPRHTNNRGHNPTQGSTPGMPRANASADA